MMAWPLPEPKSACWAWCQPDGSGPKPRDAAALPHNGTAHEYRNAKGLWGHKAFRLVPVVYKGLGMGEMVLVHEEDSKVQLRVRPGLLLDWYEGLLVLDALSRNAEPCKWLENLAGRLQKEKATRKLSASLYVSKKLLHTAVTGPQFVTREGKVVAHRRKLRSEPAPTLDDPATEEPGWYKVEKILDYMPPWDSFVHPKCGLYQEFYLIQWAGPQVMESYADTPQGCEEHPDATWEPDECLPDELDALRIQAKKKWLETSRERDAPAPVRDTDAFKVQKAEGRVEEMRNKRSFEEPSNSVRKLPPHKMAKVYNLDLSCHLSHGLKGEEFQANEQAELHIKEGWPKHPSEYPHPYEPAVPPGCCKHNCGCMEDWLAGDCRKPWLEIHLRNQAIQNSLENFKSQGNILRLRGQVTGQVFIEPHATTFPTGTLQSRKMAWQVASLVHQAIGAVVTPLPLAALSEEGGSDILKFITMLQDSEQMEKEKEGGPFEPLAFKKVAGPDWLVVDISTGQIGTIAKDTPRAFKAETFPVRVEFIGAFPEHTTSLQLQIGPTKPALPDTLVAWTDQIMDRVRETAILAFPLENIIKKVYDPNARCLRKKVTLASWLKTMKQVYTIARVASSSAAARLS